MKKTELHDMVLETVSELVKEAELSTGDNNFTTLNSNILEKLIEIRQ